MRLVINLLITACCAVLAPSVNAGDKETFVRDFVHKFDGITAVHLVVLEERYLPIGEKDELLLTEVHQWADPPIAFRDVSLTLRRSQLSQATVVVGGSATWFEPAAFFFDARDTSVIPGPVRGKIAVRRFRNGELSMVEEVPQRAYILTLTNAATRIDMAVERLVGDESCMVLSNTNSKRTISFWVDKERLVIRKLVSRIRGNISVTREFSDFTNTSFGYFPMFSHQKVDGAPVMEQRTRVNLLDFPDRLDRALLDYHFPYGTSVEDARVSPALTYVQGDVHYSDEELVRFAAERNAGKVVNIGVASEAVKSDSDGNQSAGSLRMAGRWLLGFTAAILWMTGGILVRRS